MPPEGQEFGTVAVGRRADLLLLDGNPLAGVANAGKPAGAMVGGRWLTAADLQQMLADITSSYPSAAQ